MYVYIYYLVWWEASLTLIFFVFFYKQVQPCLCVYNTGLSLSAGLLKGAIAKRLKNHSWLRTPGLDRRIACVSSNAVNIVAHSFALMSHDGAVESRSALLPGDHMFFFYFDNVDWTPSWLLTVVCLSVRFSCGLVNYPPPSHNDSCCGLCLRPRPWERMKR